MDSTARLLLQKPNPDPLTGDFVDISVLNANADKLDAAIGATPVTSATRPASPFQGQVIVETDTGKAYIYLSAAWVQLLLGPAKFNATLTSELGLPADNAILARVSGDVLSRFILESDGKQWWGDGAITQDTNLYRSAANTLKTDDSLVVAGGLTVTGSFYGGAFEEVITGFSIAANWTLNGMRLRRTSGLRTVWLNVARSGGDLTETGGNIADTLIGTLPAGWWPPEQTSANLQTGFANIGCSLMTDGNVYARAASGTLLSGHSGTLCATWVG